jgi:hypothetical protein
MLRSENGFRLWVDDRENRAAEAWRHDITD